MTDELLSGDRHAEREPSGEHGPRHSTSAARLDEGRHEGHGDLRLPDTFENPGMPPHQPRHADVSAKAAKRAERQVLALLTMSILASIAFVVAYFAIPIDQMMFVPFFGNLNVAHTIFGITFGLSLLGIGVGAVHWAKTLMPDTETVEERHPVAASPEDRQNVVHTLAEGGRQGQLGRRPMIAVLGGTALGLFAIPPALQLVGGLGPLPGSELSETFWQSGMRLMRDPELTPIRAADVTIGSVFHVLPQGIDSDPVVDAPDEATRNDENLGLLERKAKAAVVLIRIEPEILEQKSRDWGYSGIVAYSKICTHAGCPVGLYEQETHHLLCPCHQSTFDLAQDCRVIFGPAKRALPQLPITVDNEGYLVAAQGFMEPVGPSFWERGR